MTLGIFPASGGGGPESSSKLLAVPGECREQPHTGN